MKGSAEEAETALGGATVAAEEFGGAVGEGRRRQRRRGAGRWRKRPEAAKSGWELATEAVRDYADKAKETGQGIGDALVSGFRGAEDAVGEFVKTGKLGMRDLVTSILADLAKVSVRRFVLGADRQRARRRARQPRPGLRRRAACRRHGRCARAAAARARARLRRRAPDAYRRCRGPPPDGGVAGLRPDEVPAILQKGERVLCRAETRAFSQSQAGGGVTINIMTRDAESFRQSRTQVASDIARAVSFGRRGM